MVDDGTATMEFVSQLARGERLVRWHRKGSGGVQAALFAPFARRARSRLTPGRPGGRRSGRACPEARSRVEIFSSMPVDASAGRLRELGVTVTSNDFAWTRARFGPPRLTRGTDLVGTSLVETGVVDLERYLEAVALAGPYARGDPLLRAPPREQRQAATGDGRHRPGDRPPRPSAGTGRPARPHRPHDPQLPLHRGAHPAAGPGRYAGIGGGLRSGAEWLTSAHRPARRASSPASPAGPQRPPAGRGGDASPGPGGGARGRRHRRKRRAGGECHERGGRPAGAERRERRERREERDRNGGEDAGRPRSRSGGDRLAGESHHTEAGRASA